MSIFLQCRFAAGRQLVYAFADPSEPAVVIVAQKRAGIRAIRPIPDLFGSGGTVTSERKRALDRSLPISGNELAFRAASDIVISASGIKFFQQSVCFGFASSSRWQVVGVSRLRRQRRAGEDQGRGGAADFRRLAPDVDDGGFCTIESNGNKSEIQSSAQMSYFIEPLIVGAFFYAVPLHGEPDGRSGFLPVDSLEQQRQRERFFHLDDRGRRIAVLFGAIGDQVAAANFRFHFVSSGGEEAFDRRVQLGFQFDGQGEISS